MYSKPLKICIISQEFLPYTNWGGIAVYNYELANLYSKMGHKVTVISRYSDGTPVFEKLGSGVEVWRVGANIKRKYIIGRTLDRILHSRDVYRKVKALEFQNRFDIIETTEANLEGYVLLRDSKFCQRVIIQCNGSNAQGQIPDSFLSFLHRLDWAWSLKREKSTLQRSSVVIATSNATRQVLLNQGIVKDKIKLIYQGVDTDLFHPDENKLHFFPVEVGFVGRFEITKGIDFIWKIMEKVREDRKFRFHLKGTIHPAWRKDTERNLNRFSRCSVFHPSSSYEDMPLFYRKLDVLLQPSRFENFGLVYIEAMASGVIVFAGQNGGGSEIVQDEINGFLIDPDREEDINRVALLLLEIADKPASFEKMRELARQGILERFSLKQCAREKLALYENIRSASFR